MEERKKDLENNPMRGTKVMTDNKEMPERLLISKKIGEYFCEYKVTHPDDKEYADEDAIEYLRADEVESEEGLNDVLLDLYRSEFDANIRNYYCSDESKRIAIFILSKYHLIKKSGGSNNGNSPV